MRGLSYLRDLPPDLSRDVADEAQLRLLLLQRHRARDLARGETALWAEREPFERDVLRRLLDARDQLLGSSSVPSFVVTSPSTTW